MGILTTFFFASLRVSSRLKKIGGGFRRSSQVADAICFCYNSYMKPGLVFLLLLPLLLLNFCATRKEIRIKPTQPTPTENGLIQYGIASWYGSDFHGKRTADGEIYDMYKLTAAHKQLPFHTLVEVTNLDNQKKVIVRINDRGPFIKGRIIDLSKKAGQRIGIENTGTAQVRLRIIKPTDVGRNTQPEVTKIEPEAEPEAEPEPETEVNTATDTYIEPPQPAPTPAPEPGAYYLQAGAFRAKKNAKRLLRLIKKRVPEVSGLFDIDYDKGFYKVVSVKMDLRDAAEELKNRLDTFDIKSLVRKVE